MPRVPSRDRDPALRPGKGRAGEGGDLLTIEPVPPFDFVLSASIFSSGDPRIRSYGEGTFRQVVRVNGELILVNVTSGGTVDHPEVKVQIQPGPTRTRVLKAAGEAVTPLFNLDLDLSPFMKTVRDNSVMSAIARPPGVSGPRGPRRSSKPSPTPSSSSRSPLPPHKASRRGLPVPSGMSWRSMAGITMHSRRPGGLRMPPLKSSGPAGSP